MSNEIKTLTEALAAIKDRDATIASLTTDLSAARADLTQAQADLSTAQGDLKAANDLLEEEQTAHAQAKADLKVATEANTKHEAEASAVATLHAEIGIKVDADKETNSAALKRHCDNVGSAKALQITSSQGADAPLPTGAKQPDEQAPGASKRPAEIFQAQVDRIHGKA